MIILAIAILILFISVLNADISIGAFVLLVGVINIIGLCFVIKKIDKLDLQSKNQKAGYERKINNLIENGTKNLKKEKEIALEKYKQSNPSYAKFLKNNGRCPACLYSEPYYSKGVPAGALYICAFDEQRCGKMKDNYDEQDTIEDIKLYGHSWFEPCEMKIFCERTKGQEVK